MAERGTKRLRDSDTEVVNGPQMFVHHFESLCLCPQPTGDIREAVDLRFVDRDTQESSCSKPLFVHAVFPEERIDVCDDCHIAFEYDQHTLDTGISVSFAHPVPSGRDSGTNPPPRVSE